jgi:hypothetical protein
LPNKGWPEDIRPQWFNVIRRLQSVARENNQGLAVLDIRVLVDQEGTPITWTEPKRTLLEPKRMSEHVLELLTETVHSP